MDKVKMKIIASLEKLSRPFWAIVGFALIGVVGLIDFLTGYEIASSLFYLIPIALITWFGGTRLGVAASIASALAWYIADIAAGNPASPFVHYWNTGIRLGFFVIVLVLLAALKRALRRAEELSRIDYLTGAVNRRFFLDLAQREIDRSRRYKHRFTVAYIDLDNFKTVNDQFGHNTGDEVLRIVASTAKTQLRTTDSVARLGGDEFALLLPETGQEGARIVISKIQRSLLSEMQKKGWPVTFSIGLLTCIEMPNTSDELINMADVLMYSVKNNGKNAISDLVYAG
ncbi:MAG: diguanylate cyclase [Gammaproteobacteria bacterium]